MSRNTSSSNQPVSEKTSSEQAGSQYQFSGYSGWIIPRMLPLVMALVFVAATWMFVQVTSLPPSWQAFLFGVLCLATILRLTFVVYFAVGFSLMAELGRFEYSFMGPSDIVFVFCAMLYMMFAFRYADLQINFGDLLSSRNVSSDTGMRNRAHWRTLRPFRAGWIWVPAAILSAVLLLLIFGWDDTTIARYGITPPGMRVIGLIWFLAVVWFVLDTGSRLLTRREGGAMRGQVFARSVFARELKTEFYSIERKRASRKFRRKLDKTNSE